MTSALVKYLTPALAEPWLVASSTPGNVRHSLVLLTSSHSTTGGRSGTAPGLVTGAVMGGLLQWVFNEFDILRITHISRAAHPRPVPSIPAAPTQPIETRPSAFSVPVPTPEPPRSLTDRIFAMFGHKLSDEEYLDRIKAQRDNHLRRIEQLERELDKKREP
jgi:hypothetical protein